MQCKQFRAVVCEAKCSTCCMQSRKRKRKKALEAAACLLIGSSLAVPTHYKYHSAFPRQDRGQGMQQTN